LLRTSSQEKWDFDLTRPGRSTLMGRQRPGALAHHDLIVLIPAGRFKTVES
jgi:hypothetical protein